MGFGAKRRAAVAERGASLGPAPDRPEMQSPPWALVLAKAAESETGRLRPTLLAVFQVMSVQLSSGRRGGDNLKGNAVATREFTVLRHT